MNEIRVTMKQFVKLHKSAAFRQHFMSNGTPEFDEDGWARDVKEILGYLPPPGEYRIVVSDEMVTRIR